MRRRAAGAPVARLATLAPTGAPHLVPFCFVLDGDTLYSAIDAKPKRTRLLRRLDNVRADARATVLLDHYEEDWTRLWWVRIDGRARVVEEGPELERALALLAAKYPQYRSQPPAGPVLAVDAERWSGWSAS
jgi:PPOX class probable F420-dependent enzyme